LASRTKGTVWTERALVALILASLAGALFLTISVYRRALKAPSPVPVQPPSLVATTEPEPAPEPEPRPEPAPPVAAAPAEPVPPPEPEPPQEDPTEKALAQLAEATQREIAETRRLDQRLRELEAARRAAVAQSENWRRRDMLVKRQIAEMTRKAQTIDHQADQYAAQRDVLARLRDNLKAAHARAEGRGSYAVLPYKGENGTWRRPIVLECANGAVTLRPNGPTFSMLDLSGLVNPRSSPVIVAIARELLKVQASDSPDGAPVVPYFVFLVRPDGIRPYYEARARLEPLGIAFGYELIDQDLKVDVPDFDDLATWDGSPGGPPPPAVDIASGALAGDGDGDDGPESGGGPIRPGSTGGTGATNRGPITDALAGTGGGLSWPGAPGGAGGGHGGGDSPEDFIWSGAPGGRRDGRGNGGGQGGLSPNGPGSSASPSGNGRASSATGLASALDALPDFEPAGDGAKAGQGAEGGRPAPPGSGFGLGGLASADRGAGLGSTGTATDPKGFGGSEKTPIGGGGGNALRGGRGPIGAPGPGGLEPAPGGNPGAGGLAASSDKPDAGGLMWGDDPSSAAGPMSSAGTERGATAGVNPGTGRPASGEPGSTSGAGSESSPRPPLVALGGDEATAGGKPGGSPSQPGLGVSLGPLGDLAEGAGSGGGSRPLLSLGGDAESASRKLGGSPPTPGPGAGLDPLGELAGLLGGAAGGGGSSGGGASAGGSGLMLGSEANSSPSASANSSQPTDELEEALAKRRLSDGPSAVIEVPFDITVACGPDGLTIQPGGYRITAKALEEGRAEKLLVRHLASAVRRRALADPSIRPRPRVKFLVERNGGSTFWEARKQILFADLNWPMTLQVAGGQTPRLFDHEAWR